MFKDWTKKDYIFYISSMLLIIIAGIYFKTSLIPFMVSALGLTAGVMNTKGNKYCNFFYIAQISLYAYISFKNKFFGEAVLAAFYMLPMYFYSVWKWIIKSKVDERTEIYKIDKKTTMALIIAGISITAGYGYVLFLLGSNLPYLNSLGTFASIAAGYLYARRVKEQWIFWSSYTLILTTIWISTLQYDTTQITMIIQNIPFLIINITGYVNWQRMYKENRKRLNN